MPYLKSALPLDTVCEVTILERKEPITDKFNPAKCRYPYVMKYAGTVYDHEATETENGGGLCNMQVNETVHAKKVTNKFGKESVYWSLSTGAESRALAQPVTNLQSDANKKAAAEYEQAKKDEAHKKEMGYAKSQIGNNLGMSTKLFFDALLDLRKQPTYTVLQGMTTPVPVRVELTDVELADIFMGALTLAKSVRPRFNKVVDDCYMEDIVGVHKESPKDSGIPTMSTVDVSDLPF
jgi:hypothetical protein